MRSFDKKVKGLGLVGEMLDRQKQSGNARNVECISKIMDKISTELEFELVEELRNANIN